MKPGSYITMTRQIHTRRQGQTCVHNIENANDQILIITFCEPCNRWVTCPGCTLPLPYEKEKNPPKQKKPKKQKTQNKTKKTPNQFKCSSCHLHRDQLQLFDILISVCFILYLLYIQGQE